MGVEWKTDGDKIAIQRDGETIAELTLKEDAEKDRVVVEVSGPGKNLGEFEGYRVWRGTTFEVVPRCSNVVDLRLLRRLSFSGDCGKMKCLDASFADDAARKAYWADLERRFEEHNAQA